MLLSRLPRCYYAAEAAAFSVEGSQPKSFARRRDWYMKGSDELLTIAELAVGLAGIAGLVVAFTRHGRLLPTDRFRFIVLFSQALFVAALAFVPFGFHHAGQAGPALWSASSGIMVLLWVCSAWWVGVHLRPDSFSPGEDLPKSFYVALAGPATFSLLLQIANFVGWPMESGVLSYLVGLLLWLSIPALVFAALVLNRAEK